MRPRTTGGKSLQRGQLVSTLIVQSARRVQWASPSASCGGRAASVGSDGDRLAVREKHGRHGGFQVNSTLAAVQFRLTVHLDVAAALGRSRKPARAGRVFYGSSLRAQLRNVQPAELPVRRSAYGPHTSGQQCCLADQLAPHAAEHLQAGANRGRSERFVRARLGRPE